MEELLQWRRAALKRASAKWVPACVMSPHFRRLSYRWVSDGWRIPMRRTPRIGLSDRDGETPTVWWADPSRTRAGSRAYSALSALANAAKRRSVATGADGGLLLRGLCPSPGSGWKAQSCI